MSTVVRIKDDIHQRIKKLTMETGTSAQEVLDRALTAYEKERFWASVDDAYEALKQDKNKWQEELDERKIWDRTLLDE